MNLLFQYQAIQNYHVNINLTSMSIHIDQERWTKGTTESIIVIGKMRNFRTANYIIKFKMESEPYSGRGE
jgi:hypothetical protein